jgi:Ion channel
MNRKNEDMRPPPAKKGRKWRRVRPDYAWLLCMILCYLIVSGFEDRHLLVWATGIFLKIAIFVLALHVSDVGRKYFLAAVSLALIVTGASVPARLYHGGLEVLVLLTWSALMLVVPVAILRKIGKEFTEEGVDLEVVLGALCAYLFIGSYFAFLYDVMANLSKSPFFAQPGADSKLNYLYFSFITLTTTGYGDISPAFGPGRMIAVTEAVIGQLYLVSVVAIVVSAFGKRKKSPS